MTRFFFIALSLLTTLLLAAPAMAITMVDSAETQVTGERQLGDVASDIVSTTQKTAAPTTPEVTEEPETAKAPVMTRGLFAIGTKGETRAPLGTGLPATLAIFGLVGVMFVLPRRQFVG